MVQERGKGLTLELLGGWRAFQIRKVLPGRACICVEVFNKEGMIGIPHGGLDAGWGLQLLG